ncbi:MAG: TylF/MycF/NovP-related O-methyltransferase [Rhodospirillaceae bacterium]
MQESDFVQLVADLEIDLAHGARAVGILGLTPVTLRILSHVSSKPAGEEAFVVYADGASAGALTIPIRPFAALSTDDVDVVVVASDEDKELLLEAALPHIRGTPKVILAGYSHLTFKDSLLQDELAQLLVPSLANGYPNTIVHLYQSLANAARLGLKGVVAEFGMFKGGTTVLLSRLVERLGMNWPVIGFDTFEGFPPRRSVLDMYAHPDCVFTDLDAVKRYCSGRNIEIVPGDIVETCERLANEDLVVTFIDTDNYTPATAAIRIVRERTVVGGTIVFDHFTGVDRFRYTLGERFAAKTLLSDPRYFNLHGTGVFYRQR